MRIPSIRLIAIAAMAPLWLSAAYGQTVPGQAPVVATPKLNLTMEDEHTLKEILLKDSKYKHDPAQPALKPGDTVPQSVTLYEFPAMVDQKVPQIKSHRFFIAGDRIVIVRAEERKVVEVVK